MAKAAHHEAPHQTESQNGQQFRGMIQPEAVIETYGKFLKQMEAINRQWLGSMRQTAEAGWELASQMTDSAMADGRRLSDLYLRLYEADMSAATSAVRQMGSETTSAASRHLSAVQRSSVGD
ncbi:MAG TPA: hypothetical protein VGB82_20320 [Alphaproteobacteria bacterium]